MTARAVRILVLTFWGLGAPAGESRPAEPVRHPRLEWLPQAPPLPQPAGEIIRVATVEDLFAAVEQVRPGGTILMADGHYLLPRCLDLHTDRVTLRSESGRRDLVILDGARSAHGELLAISRCAGATVADLTVQNIKWNGIKINSDRGATRVTLYNCVLHNIWQRGVKGPAVPRDRLEELRPRNCRIQYCLFYNDRPKQFSDDPADRPDNFGGNYIGGIDVMYPQGWTISDNVFIGIQGRTREARGAVFLWHDARGCLIERNVIIDCDSGICLGNSHRPPEIAVHATGCIVRNNFLVRCPENGILADYTRDCRIVHNTIHDPDSRLKRLIRVVHDNDGLAVLNNLLSGPPMRLETESAVQIEDNVTRDAGRWFIAPSEGNLHLKNGRIAAAAKGPRRADAPQDFDRRARPATTIAGADELDTAR